MKRKKQWISLLSIALLLTGCSSTPTESDYNPSVTESTTEGEKEENLISGQFKKTEDGYQSLEASSMMLLPQAMEEGTFQSEMTVTSKIADNGIFFAYDASSKSYYFFGRNLVGKIVLQKTENGKTSVLKTVAAEEHSSYELAVFIDREENTIDCYLGEEFLFQVEEESLLSGQGIGLKAGSKETSYSSIAVTSDINVFNNNVYRYNFAHGEFDLDETDHLVSTTKSALGINEERTFIRGVYEADITFLNNPVSQNGLVFSHSSTKKNNYWEGTGISYYFFYITESGRVCLGRTKDGKWATVFEKVIRPFDEEHTYRMKVIKGENVISCYVDDILYGTYTDAAPLSGAEIGVRSGDSQVAFSDIRIHEIEEEKKDLSSLLNVGNGSFYGLSQQIISADSSSIMTMKGKTKKYGTLKTFLSPRGSGDNGIIFRVTRPETGFKKEGENTSYYWFGYQNNGMVSFKRVENGKVIKSKDKFLPWGSYSYMGYEVKIVMDENDFYCYFDGRLAVTYHDETPLTGEEYGFLADGKSSIMDWIEEEEDKTPEHYETLIFGHSYMDYWYTYQEDLDEYESIYDIGIGASVTSHWNDYTDEVIAYQPKLGIYGIGINDISSNVSSQTIVSNVKKMLTDIKTALPEFEVVLWGVSRCPARTSYNTEISSVNQGYQSLASQFSWIHYVDVEMLFCNSSGSPIASYFTDGLHPTHEGYLLMVDAMRNALK